MALSCASSVPMIPNQCARSVRPSAIRVNTDQKSGK
jgi:hypothetical protein